MGLPREMLDTSGIRTLLKIAAKNRFGVYATIRFSNGGERSGPVSRHSRDSIGVVYGIGPSFDQHYFHERDVDEVRLVAKIGK